MGEYVEYQPLEQQDKVSVVLYRLGIGFSAVFLGALAVLSTPRFLPSQWGLEVEALGQIWGPEGNATAGLLLFGLVLAVGASVVSIHLYDSRFLKFLKSLYVLALLGFLCLLGLGGGNPSLPLVSAWYGPLLLLPLAGCLAFVSAKEAVCFGLTEGFVLAIIMPTYLLVASTGVLTAQSAVIGLWAIFVVLVLFTLRKVFMPLHCDIGDKSAYQ
jgi:uncharacterized integral membrane protein